MASPLIRLIALIALVIMPLGMSGTAAIAAPSNHDPAMSQSGHCQEQGKQEQQDAPASKKMDCAAACIALPATAAAGPMALLKPTAPRTIASAASFSGIVPEIATPPPKLG